MSRSWTPEEIQKVSEAMKAAGHMGYEEFCEHLNEQTAKAALERFARVQRDHRFACPRCGQWTMKERTVTNALSRHAEVYICDQCGTEEAVLDYLGKPLPLSQWSFITDVRDALTE